MTVSVCMCTYQGEEFLEKQLLSLFEQTRMPDEVIICDDGSSDHTLELAQAFVQERHLGESWRVIRNESNLGFLANFYHACSLCQGDIVFFADQDDIWHPEKIERMCEIFEQKPDARVVCCKFCLIDAKDQRIESVAAPVHAGGSAKVKALDIESVFRKCEWPAMVLAFRRAWYLGWKQMTQGSQIPHDYLFCAKAAEEDGFYQLDLELASHRLHDGNVAKEEHRLKELLQKKRKLEEIDEYLRFLEAFRQEKVLVTKKGRAVLARKHQIMTDRREALLSGSIRRILRNKGKYGKDIRLATLICDLWIAKQA